jgi:hypothetical protein
LAGQAELFLLLLSCQSAFVNHITAILTAIPVRLPTCTAKYTASLLNGELNIHHISVMLLQAFITFQLVISAGFVL